MSEDKRGPRNLSKDDDNVAAGTETTFPSEVLDTQTANGSNEGDSRDSAGEGILEKLPIREEMEDCGFGYKLPELESSAFGDNQEVSTSSGSVPNVIIGIEDLHQAFLSHAKNEFAKLNIIKINLLEIIRDLKQMVLQNSENWAFIEVLRNVINKAYAVLDINKKAMSKQQSIQQFINFEMYQCIERLTEAGEISLGAILQVGKIKGFDILIKKDCRASSAEENVDKIKIAMELINQMLEAASLRQNARAMAEESKIEVSAVGMEADGSAEEPRVMEEAADVNMVEVGDDDKMLQYPVTRKYTLAIRSRQMYPESSSEDSPSEKPEQYLQGAGENVGRGVDVMEERMAEDPQDASSSDSPIE